MAALTPDQIIFLAALIGAMPILAAWAVGRVVSGVGR